MNKLHVASMFCLLLLGACGDEDASSGPSNSNVDGGLDAAQETGEDASDADASDGATSDADASEGDTKCAQVAQLRCDLYVRCLPTAVVLYYGDESGCLRDEQAACEIELSAPGVAFTADDRLACETERNAASCEDYLLNAYYGAPSFAACELPAGTVADGETCLVSSQCASGYCDNEYVPEPACGHCGTLMGPTCLGVECAADEGCWKPAGSSDPLECTKAVGVGESCESNPCLDGAPCDNGVCPAPVFGKEGASCDPQATYNFFWNPKCYLMEYMCDSATETCVPMPTPAASGEPCEATLHTCAGGNACVNDNCQPKASLGEACGEYGCEHPASCFGGTCQLPSTDLCQ